MILFIVSEWYYDSNGVTPAIIEKRVAPKDQRSTLSSYPPPKSISGAKYSEVPMMVSMSLRAPLW